MVKTVTLVVESYEIQMTKYVEACVKNFLSVLGGTSKNNRALLTRYWQQIDEAHNYLNVERYEAYKHLYHSTFNVFCK